MAENRALKVFRKKIKDYGNLSVCVPDKDVRGLAAMYYSSQSLIPFALSAILPQVRNLNINIASFCH